MSETTTASYIPTQMLYVHVETPREELVRRIEEVADFAMAMGLIGKYGTASIAAELADVLAWKLLILDTVQPPAIMAYTYGSFP